jgi:myo-inositol-1(or 4)-monophosphatase
LDQDEAAQGSRSHEVDLGSLLTIAVEAAADAAALLLEEWRGDIRLCPSPGKTGIVTQSDLRAESRIREAILSRRPRDAFLGEESGDAEGRSGVRWIVDPLDGTNNYLTGSRDWGVSLGIEVDGAIELGVVDMPAAGSVYTAMAGVGAWRNGQPLEVFPSEVCDLKQAVVATGFSADSQHRDLQLEQLRRVLRQVRDVRCRGAASVELCGVASGEVDAYYESDLRVWDVAAGALIAVEAGLAVSGGPWSGDGTLVAAPPALAKPLTRLVDSP